MVCRLDSLFSDSLFLDQKRLRTEAPHDYRHGFGHPFYHPLSLGINLRTPRNCSDDLRADSITQRFQKRLNKIFSFTF